MSLIACTDHCVYQKDGYCTLSRANSRGEPCAESPCVNFVPRRSEHGGQRLTDIVDADEL